MTTALQFDNAAALVYLNTLWDWEGLFKDKDRRNIPAATSPARGSVISARQTMRRTDRVESWSPSSDWVPPWQDKPTLCMCLCLSENTVDAWVRQGLLPPPRKRGGKLMWKW